MPLSNPPANGNQSARSRTIRTIRSVRPVGQVTRGKTALNRLRQIDTFIALAWSNVLTEGALGSGSDPLVVDVGYGAQAWTALEMWERWKPFNPRLRLLGLEIEAERVANAQPHNDPPVVQFQLGGFNVADSTGREQVRIIRAYNVLRQYDESAVSDALATMALALAPNGLLIEGTSNPSGRIVAFDVYRKIDGSLQHQMLVFGTNFQGDVDPSTFQAILPKRLIHRMLDKQPAQFFDSWTRAYALARGQGQTGRRHVWNRAAVLLRTQFGYPVDPRLRLIRRGFLALHASLRPEE